MILQIHINIFWFSVVSDIAESKLMSWNSADVLCPWQCWVKLSAVWEGAELSLALSGQRQITDTPLQITDMDGLINSDHHFEKKKCLLTFFTYSQPGPSFINLFVQYPQSDLPPLRPCTLWWGPGPRFEPGTGGSSGRDTRSARPGFIYKNEKCNQRWFESCKITRKNFTKLTRHLQAYIIMWDRTDAIGEFCNKLENYKST